MNAPIPNPSASLGGGFTSHAGVGVLMVNLGTPAEPTPGAIAAYLREFLSDRRVVELPRALWLPILYGLILPLRPWRLAHAYEQIWTSEGSPLLAISLRQMSALQQALGPDIVVALGMRYGHPSIGGALKLLQRHGVRRILVLPLYPQYSGSTTASALDAVFAALRGVRWLPELRTVNQYHDHAHYIGALAASLRTRWADHERGAHLLMSFHGVPRRYVEAGDPYEQQCRDSATLLAQALGLGPEEWSLAFQSRFGKAEWLQPYADVQLAALARQGVERVDVICPGFSADCLETLEEVAIRYERIFVAAGGRKLNYIPALNDDDAHIEALADIVRRNTRGWV